jgi:hypothetical protein
MSDVMTSKLPAIQFYPSDWRNDLGVQSLSRNDRMVWFEMILLMHESERRGVLVLNGKAMSDEMIAQLLNLDNHTFNQIRTLLIERGIASIEPQTGALMNRRMVRDEHLRKIRAEVGRRGGNPALLKQKPTTLHKQNPTPSSSSSISFSPSSSSSNVLSSLEEERTKEESFLNRANTRSPARQSPPAPDSQEQVTLPEYINRDAWDGFVEMRKKQHWPITGRALKSLLSDLRKIRDQGYDPNAALDQSTARCYRGIFAPTGVGGRNDKSIAQSKQDATINAARKVISGIRGVDHSAVGEDRDVDGRTGERGALCLDGG